MPSTSTLLASSESFGFFYDIPDDDWRRRQRRARTHRHQLGPEYKVVEDVKKVNPQRWLLNNYYPNQTATGQILTEMWRQVGLNVEIQMKENFSQVFDRGSPRGVRDWSNSALYNDPLSSLVNQHGPKGQQQQIGEWTNEEMNKLSVELETSTDRPKRRAMFRRMLEICEREDPAYTVLHQTAIFTAKRKDIAWKAAPSFAMDFRSHNFKINRG